MSIFRVVANQWRSPSWMSLSRASRQRRASVTVEFALVAPFLTFLLLGTFELARGIMVKQMLNDAARKACREGVLPGKGNTDITNQVNDILRDNGFAPTIATIKILVGPAGSLPLNGSAVDALTARPGLDYVSV